MLITHPLLAPRSRKDGAITLSTLRDCSGLFRPVKGMLYLYLNNIVSLSWDYHEINLSLLVSQT
jgi:hypothetical protein